MKLSASEQEELLINSEHIRGYRMHEDDWEDNWDGDESPHRSPVRSWIRAEDGKYYVISWQKGYNGLDPLFEDGEVQEVKAYARLTLDQSRVFLSDEEVEHEKPQLEQQLLSESESFAIAMGMEIGASISERVAELAEELLESLDELQPIDIAANAGAYREATRQYLRSIVKLWEEKNHD